MSGALIIDTETTGIENAEVIQLGYMGPLREIAPPDDSVQVAHFRPSKPIGIGALATHHILDEDLTDAPPWPGSWTPPIGTEYLIGHNIDFDWKAIGSPHVARICTLALARSLWPDLESHSLSALTYHFTDHREARDLLRNAHDAGRDVELCCRVLVQILRALPQITTWHHLWLASEKARVPLKFPFGQYRGQLISDVRARDRSYISWCLKQPFVLEDPYLLKALRGETH